MFRKSPFAEESPKLSSWNSVKALFEVDEERLDHPGYAYWSSLRSIAEHHHQTDAELPFSHSTDGQG